MGQIIGGALAIIVLAWLVEWVVVKRIMNDPAAGGVVSVVAAYVIAVIIYGFGSANGQGWQSTGTIVYLPGAAIVGLWFWVKGKSQRDSEP